MFGAALLWCIWQNRNEVVWQGRSKQAIDIHRSARLLCSQWSSADSTIVNHSSIYLPDSRRWQKPPQHVLKCNVDAAVFLNSTQIGFGCILRNFQGVVIEATHGIISGCFNSTLAEALSIREALG